MPENAPTPVTATPFVCSTEALRRAADAAGLVHVSECLPSAVAAIVCGPTVDERPAEAA